MTKIAFVFAGFLLYAGFSSAADILNPGAANCVFTDERCACRKQTNAGGICLRQIAGSNDSCRADNCQAGGYVCDCLGDEICARSSCNAWKASPMTSPLQVGQDYTCELDSGATCLVPIEAFKMVQFGPNKIDMFNMTVLDDTIGLGNGKRMHDAWPDKESLKTRHINIRLYKASDGSAHLCTIYNDYGQQNDNIGKMSVTAVVTGVQGQVLDITACDDTYECPSVRSKTSHTLKHKLIVTHSDGWCVNPLKWDGDSVTLKFSGLERFEGIIFHGADSSTNGVYDFEDLLATSSITGTLDSNGLINGGALPEITFNFAGIPVYQDQQN